MKKKISLILLLIFIISLTGCSSNQMESVNAYAIYSLDLINCFSINSNSPMISSEKTIDSINISYENGDNLNLKLVSKNYDVEIELIYKSNQQLSLKTLSKIISIITGDSLLIEEEEKLESFLNTNGKLTTTIDGGIFELEQNENVFILKTSLEN